MIIFQINKSNRKKSVKILNISLEENKKDYLNTLGRKR